MRDKDFIAKTLIVANVERERNRITFYENVAKDGNPLMYEVRAVMVADDDCSLEIVAYTPELVEG